MDLHYGKAGDQRGVRSGPSLHKRVAVFPLRSAKQVRQLGDAGRDLSCLLLGHEICHSASSRLRLEIDVSHRRFVVVLTMKQALLVSSPVHEAGKRRAVVTAI
jgi:hypothetical protein